jgi:hypothetical protein
MKLYEMIERVREIFPEKGETAIIRDLNYALKVLCYETKILTSEVDLFNQTLVDDTGDELTDESGDNLETAEYGSVYPLPYDVYEVERLETTGLYYYLLEHGAVSFFYDREQLEPQVLTANTGATAVLHYVRHPKTLSALEDEPEMPEDFHEAPVFAVLKKYHMLAGNDKKMLLIEREYLRLKHEALKYAGTRQDATSYEVTPFNWRG